MRNHPNQIAIAQARQEMSAWRNDRGGNAGQQVYYPQNRNFRDQGTTVYHDPGRQAVEVSLPHILQIVITGGGTFNITLFNANVNYVAANQGNNVAVAVTYVNNNPLIPFTYSSLLGTILSEPMQVGVTRIQTVTTAQATAVIAVTRNPGVGKIEGITLIPLIYPNQFIQNIAYVEYAYKVDKFTNVQYTQVGATDASILMYFYANQNVNLDRTFSNEKVIQEYAKPQTGIAQQMEVVSAMGSAAPNVRSGSLL